MTSPQDDDPIALLAAAYSRQGEILEYLLEHTGGRRDPRLDMVVVDDERTLLQMETPEQRAVVAHYEQLRSQLGRPGAQMAVRIRRLERDRLMLFGEPIASAQMIEVDSERTLVGREWRRDPEHPDTLIWHGEGAEHVHHGAHVRLYAGPTLVGIGYWLPDPPRKTTKGR